MNEDFQESFRGDVLHSSEFKSSDAYKGKKALVVGACNSGILFIAANMALHDAEDDIRSVLRSS